METPPAPGKWSARDIVSHLADAEVVFAFRLRQTLAEDHHVIQPFDQDLWAKSYPACDAQLALAALSAVRAWNMALIRSVKAGRSVETGDASRARHHDVSDHC